jgi:3-oxoacyl-[acyl-carrier protein] reductase
MKTFILTGATGGIGKEILKKLLEKNFFVIATDIDKELLSKLKKDNSNFSNQLITEILDVRKEENWKKIIKKATEQKFPFYGLIHSAGVLLPAYIENTNSKDLDFHIDINVKGSIIGSQLASKILIQKKEGHIFHIASLAGISPVPGIALYSCSKFAIRGFSLALSIELEKYNVRVTTICPDAVSTPMLDLQKDYEEAALTFSGASALSPSVVAEAVVNNIGENIFEINLPFSRSIQAKFAGLFPQFASKLLLFYRNKGLKNQKKYSKSK